MGVDGSVTNVDYYIPASSEDDRFITKISIILGYGTTGQPFQFADGTALSNGVRIFYENTVAVVDIADAVKSNQDFFRLNENQIDSDWEVREGKCQQ